MSNEEKNKLTRNSNLEILRIICMILIVAHHYVVHGGFIFGYDVTVNRIFLEFLSFGGKLGVNCYVLITGYFLSGIKGKRWKSTLKLWIQATVYSLVIYMIALITGVARQNIGILITYLFPILYEVWWFTSIYFVLVLIAPVINIFINSVTQEQFKKSLILMIVVAYVIPTLSFFGVPTNMQMNNTILFIVLYLIAAYIRKYGIKKNIKWSELFWTTILIQNIYICVMDLLGIGWDYFAQRAMLLTYDMHSFLLLVMSIALFCCFANKKEFYNPYINKIAATTFGVYLIHDNPFVRNYLWQKLLHQSTLQESRWLILHALISVVVVYAACSIISWIYNLVFGRIIAIILEKYGNNIEYIIISIWEFIKTIFGKVYNYFVE